MVSIFVILEVVLLVFICFGALTGNLMLFFLVFKTRELQTNKNVFLLNLAAADLLVAINMITTIVTVVTEDWAFGSVFCKISGFLFMLTFVASCMSLTMVSVNRYHGVVDWMQFQEKYTRRKCALYIIFVWLLTLGLSLPPLFGWTAYDFDKKQSFCFAEWSLSKSYTLFMVIACLVCPACVMSYCYMKITCYMKQSRRNLVETMNAPQIQKNAGLRQRRKVVRTLVSYVAVFLFCWSPFAIVMLVEVFAGLKVPRAVDFGSLVLGFLNSFLNVLVYNATNRQIRKRFIQLLRRKP